MRSVSTSEAVRGRQRPPKAVVYDDRAAKYDVREGAAGREPGTLTADSVAPRRPILNLRIRKSKLNLPRSNAAKRSFLAPMGVPWRSRNFRPQSATLPVVRLPIPGRR